MRRRIKRNVIGKDHHCRICSRPMRSGAPTTCADCLAKGYVGNVMQELEDALRIKIQNEVDSWKPKQS